MPVREARFMNPSLADPTHPILKIRRPRASSVIVQRIPPDAVDGFLQWQDGVSAAAAEFAGYQTTEVYPPGGKQPGGKQPGGKQPEGMHPEWVVVVHFDDARTLQDWLDSGQRAEWLAKLPSETKDFQLKMLPAGLGSWFAGAPEGVG